MNRLNTKRKMKMYVDRTRLIAALRDTAAKALEVTEVDVPDFEAEMRSPHFNRDRPLTRKEARDTYSKDWIAGRLLGMADVIEAMTSEETP
jgi:hypothetical protein